MHWPVRQKTPVLGPALSNAQVAAGTADHSAESVDDRLHYTTVAHILHSRLHYVTMITRNETAP